MHCQPFVLVQDPREGGVGPQVHRAGGSADQDFSNGVHPSVKQALPLAQPRLGHPVWALRKAGYTVLLADSGEQAVRMATDHAASIDLLFTDIVMPGIHGIALAKSMRATRPGIRVLITSGYTQDDVVRRGVDMGETPFLAKPYTPSGLVAAVEAALA